MSIRHDTNRTPLFTGIVQGLCPVVAIEDQANLRKLTVDSGILSDALALGASVAINGTCLTVTSVSNGSVSFDVIKESLGLTNLGRLTVGSLVNVERSFRVGDEVGGHILSGHICDCVEVSRVEESENLRNLYFRVPEKWMKYLHHKGFVALDGASLTIASVDDQAGTMSVSLIPETIGRTTLGSVGPGDRVNLEIDAQTQSVVETVERVLASDELRSRLTRSAGKWD